MSATAKQKRKNGSAHNNKFLGVQPKNSRLNPRSAAEAEVVRTKLTEGIPYFASFKEAGRHS
jgi:hypothetical protein